jgi:pimeloyl-ACP methyl ester carboxylesterase
MTRLNHALPDGRNLEYLTNGVESSIAVFLHAGTTQDIEGWTSWHEKFAAHGIQSISIGRSGYAGSTPKPGRITIDIAHDISNLSKALGINQFINIGLSGGGQHAIATGLDSKSLGVVTVGSLAPFAELGEDFYKGMQQVDIDEYADALRDMNDLVKRFQAWLEPKPFDASPQELSERDRIAQSNPSYKVLMDSCDFTMREGWDWVADDYSSYLQPWGFDPRNVKVPVIIWQGGLDKNVPVVHGEWLSRRIPGSRYELRPDESHIGLFVNYEDEIIESAIALLQ